MAAQASLLKQMGLTLRESDMIVRRASSVLRPVSEHVEVPLQRAHDADSAFCRVGGQEIGDDTFPCDSLPQESLEVRAARTLAGNCVRVAPKSCAQHSLRAWHPVLLETVSPLEIHLLLKLSTDRIENAAFRHHRG